MLTKLDLMDKGTNALDVRFIALLFSVHFGQTWSIYHLWNRNYPVFFLLVKVLEGRAYRLQHPWVGIVNRSQADINRNVDMIIARRKEQEFFASSPEYSHLASGMGSAYLAKLLSQVQ